jgi:hypothetical protein
MTYKKANIGFFAREVLKNVSGDDYWFSVNFGIAWAEFG